MIGSAIATSAARRRLSNDGGRIASATYRMGAAGLDLFALARLALRSVEVGPLTNSDIAALPNGSP
jgi:hypothetical protein